MLVRHDAVNDAAREISFSKRGALSARLFGCRFSRRVREKFENRIALGSRHRTYTVTEHAFTFTLAARTDQQAASPHAGEKSSVVMVMRKWT